MSEYKWVEGVAVNGLSNRALMLISRFARVLKQVNGRVLSLRDPDLAVHVVQEFQIAQDPRLEPIFNDLIKEFRALIEDSSSPKSRARPSDTENSVELYRGARGELKKKRKTDKSKAHKTITYRGAQIK